MFQNASKIKTTFHLTTINDFFVIKYIAFSLMFSRYMKNTLNAGYENLEMKEPLKLSDVFFE